MMRRLPQDAFVAEKHAVLWAALRECELKKVEPDDASLHRFSGGLADLVYARELKKHLNEPLSDEALDAHITTQRWDAARMQALRGPVNAFLEEAGKPNADPSRVLALADQVVHSLRGYEDRRALHEPDQLVRQVQLQLVEARSGRAVYPYGIPGLDTYEVGHDREGQPRCIPGSKPGQITTVTAVSGSGKSTIAARMALGIARQGRRVLYGAWEPDSTDMLTLMALMDLGFSRTDVSIGRITKNQEDQIVAKCEELSKMISFMGNPHALDDDGHEKRPTNERNVDLVAGYIADTGADVFVADLWERCLVSHDESEERNALFRIQRILQRAQCHGILLAQQRLKDVEVRPDRRPTREGIKGSSAWVDVSDSIIGVHLPALFKDVDENKIELIVLKQRWAPWPLAIEFDWDGERGWISGGRSVAYNDPLLGGSQMTSEIDGFLDKKGGKRGKGK